MLPKLQCFKAAKNKSVKVPHLKVILSILSSCMYKDNFSEFASSIWADLYN